MVNKPTSIEIIGKQDVSAVLSGPDQLSDSNKTGVIIAHGAANDMNNSLIVAVAESLAATGYTTLRFNFPYKDKGKKSPDTEPTLIRAWKGAVTHLLNNERFPVDRVIAVGKSMGGRIASQMVAADQMAVEALIFLGYPLHAPGRTNKLRDSHLYKIKKRMLFFAGTRDPLCNLEKLREVLDRLPAQYDLEIVKDGDHSFKLPKSSSRSAEHVYRQIVDKCLQWLDPIAK
ncbi:MAG: alpha/beta fold hydrolase [Deltaproteobacteria bacterium]|nr:alpha/beta fold hydrolase [Deltaproteobacteria bacterium]